MKDDDKQGHDVQHEIETKAAPAEGDGVAAEASGEDVTTAESASTTAGEETPEVKLARSEREREELHERLLRLAAEFENYKKRTKREIEDMAPRVREGLLREILPVVDNLERAVAATEQGGTLASFVEGVKLVEKQIHVVFEKFNVRRFDALGQPFDPTRHEAVMQLPTGDVAPGTVAQVFAQGYTMGERVLRAAVVAVAKAPPGEKPVETPPSPGDADELH